MTIFVVDDEPMLLELAETILQPLGFDVQTFRDPKKAILAFPDARPSLILTDYAMGDTTGMDVLRECRRLNPTQKVILISGTVDQEIYANATYKPDDFISKPYLVSELVRSVQTLAAR